MTDPPPGPSSPHRRSSRWPIVLLALALGGLTACAKKVPLYSDLREEEANEIMGALLEQQVACTKEAGKEDRWVLHVMAEDFPFAMQTLRAIGLPRQSYQRMGEIFQKSGLVSSPTEERIRFIYALSQELQETFMKIDGVVSARVHIALPDTDPLSENTNPASAAVFIKFRSGYNIETMTPEIKNLVTKSIESLKPENVEIVLSPAEATPPTRRLPPGNGDSAWLGRLPSWALPAGAAGAGFLVSAMLFLSLHRKPKTSPAP